MENIYNYTKFTNVSRVKYAIYPLYFTGNIDVSTAFTESQEKNTALGTPLACRMWYNRD